MSATLITTIAYVILGLTIIVDKILIGERKKHGSVVTYVFWIGILGAVGFPLIFFGYTAPSLYTLIIALLGGVSFFIALIAYYRALRAGEASQAPAIIGGFEPIATFLVGALLLSAPLTTPEVVAFTLLVLGGFVMFFSGKFNVRKVLPWVLVSALAMGFASVLQKQVFEAVGFTTGYVLAKGAVFVVALALLLWGPWRKKIFARSKESAHEHKIIYIINRAAAGIGAFLVLYALSLGDPAVIASIGGMRFVVVFIAAWIISLVRPSLLKETFSAGAVILKLIAVALILLGLGLLGIQGYHDDRPFPEDESWGITFSTLYAKRMGIDWKEAYKAMLHDLKPDAIRIAAYWHEIEQVDNDFTIRDNIDFQMSEAWQAGVPVTLVIGQKVPRWPECHYPDWIDPENKEQVREKLLEYIEVIVGQYRGHPALHRWQVENEPFLDFGECPGHVPELVHEEIELVRKMDKKHPVLVTDGGEFGDWYRAAKAGDVFGTTLYRHIFHDRFGHLTYPLSPELYPVKDTIVKWLTGKRDQKTVVIELGLEPWDKKQIYELPYDYQMELFDIENLKEDIQYARATKFDEYYVWGIEWWYWLKTEANDDRFWNYMRDEVIRKY